MRAADEVRSLVDRELARLLGVPHVERDGNGDITYPSGSSVTLVRVEDAPSGPIVGFRATLLRDVDASDQLLRRLNDLNARIPFVRFFWRDADVICAAEIPGEHLQEDEILNALSAVAAYADQADDVLHREFGGTMSDAPQSSSEGSARGQR